MPYHLEFRDPPIPPYAVMPVCVDPTGINGPTKAMAAGPGWRRTARGLYVPAETDSSQPAQRAVEAAGRLSSVGALTGWAVLHLLGYRYFDGRATGGTLPVRLQMGPHQGRRKRRGIRWPYDLIDGREEVLGLPCTTPCWTVFDEMRGGDLVHAVTTLDMAVRGRVVDLPQMRRFIEGRVGTTGVPLAREALELSSPHAGSPPETRLRLLWEHELGLPPPLVNVAVFDRAGLLLGYPDLLDEDAGLAVEYDGEHHRDPGQHSDDVDREAVFRDAGLEVARVTSRDLRHIHALGLRLLAARARAVESRGTRGWTLER